MQYNVRTDMAAEAHGHWRASAGELSELRGVRVEEEQLCALPVSTVAITDERGAALLNKRIGRYYTLTLPKHFDRGSADFSAAVHASAALLSRCLPDHPRSVLVAALGNPDITPDALGSLAASSILVTRHLDGDAAFSSFASVSLCRTGVLGTSGIESSAHVRLLCDALHPDAVIVIDALACSESERLCRTMQFTDAGISPGSGVGNDRQALDRKLLGVPVVAVGFPTVMDAADHGGEEALFVTPRSIDSLVRHAARIIGYAVNLALHGIGIEDVDALLG